MLSTLVPFQMTRKIQNFQKFPPFLHFVYLNTFFVSVSLSLSFARWRRRLVVVLNPLSLSLEKSVSFLSDDVAFVVVFVLLLFQASFRFIF